MTIKLINLEDGFGGNVPNMTRRGQYDPKVALAEACRAHLPEHAYDVHEDLIAVDSGSAFKPPPPRLVIRGATMTLSIEEMRSVIDQINDFEAEIAEHNREVRKDHKERTAKQVTELEAALATARAALAPLHDAHRAFADATKALAPVEDAIAALRTERPTEWLRSFPGSLATIREHLAAEVARQEAAIAADDERVMAVLRRRGLSVDAAA